MNSFATQLKDKKVAISLASGFFGFYHQAGVLKAIHHCGITPAYISGTSAGALVAGMYASGLSPDDIETQLMAVTRGDFWDLHWPFGRHGFGLLEGEKFSATLSSILPVHGFKQCRIPFYAGVYDLQEGRVEHLYEGSLIQGIRASCAYPYLFSPVEIAGKPYWDGGFGEKTPLVPFLEHDDIDVVLVSYMQRSQNRSKNQVNGKKKFLPPIRSLFADTPEEEVKERDQKSISLLEESRKRVMVIAPNRIWLGPFSLDKAQDAFDEGYRRTLEILNSDDESLLGHSDLLGED